MAQDIRQATTEDARLLANLIRQSFRDVAERFGLTQENCPTHPSNCTIDWVITEMGKGVLFYVLENWGTPCGCVALEQTKPGVCYLERLAVLPEFRLQGFGKALMQHALEQSRVFGTEHVKIGIIAKHTELKNWYARLGFIVEREAVTFAHLPFKVTFMSLLLHEG